MKHGLSIATVALIALGAWACGGDVAEANPAPVFGVGGQGAGVGGSGGSDVGGSGGSGGSAGSAGAAGAAGGGPIVRTVIVRDVFEDFDTPSNLMLDGGFELSGEMADTWGSYGDRMRFGNGAACRTGLRCGVAAQNSPIYGFFVSPEAGSIQISLRTKTDGAPCDAMTMAIFDAYGQGSEKMIWLASAELQPDGWCTLYASSTAMAMATPVLYLEPTHGKAHIDDVLVTTASFRTALSATPPPPVPATLKPRLDLVRARALATLQNRPGSRRSIRAGAPWTAQFDPWER